MKKNNQPNNEEQRPATQKNNTTNMPTQQKKRKKRKKEQQETQKPFKQEPEQYCKEYIDGWKRVQADFENYKKRQEQERQQIIKFSKEEFIQELLPVIDNFEEAYKHKPEELEDHAWVKGIEYIKKQFETFLEQLNVLPIPTVGKEFHEQYHEAVQSEQTQPSKRKKSKKTKMIISKEIRKGYTLDDAVIRPARVIVSIEE